MTEVFLKIVDMGIDAGFLILAVIAARLLLAKASKSTICLLWALVALRLVVPFEVQSAFSLVPDFSGLVSETTKQSAEIENGSDSEMVWQTDDLSEDSNEPISGKETQNAETMNQAEIAENESAANMAGAAEESSTANRITQIGAVVWLVVMALMLCYLLVSMLRLQRKAAARICLHGNVYQCDEVKSPFILGVFHPIICLPSGMESGTIASVLRHERAHIRRRDQLWKPLGFMILAVYWFNPLCWAAYILFCRDMEFACDERAVRGMDGAGRASYCQALLECSQNRRILSVCPIAFGEIGVKKRICAIAAYKKPTFWAAAAVLVVCGLVAICFFTSPQEGNTDDGAGAVAENESTESTEEVIAVSDTRANAETETETDSTESQEGAVLTFEDVITMVNAADWTSFVAETDADYWLGFSNITEEELSDDNNLCNVLEANYEYSGRSYRLEIQYVPERSLEYFDTPVDSIYSIYLYETDASDIMLLYEAGQTQQPDIDSFLTQSYDVFEKITMDEVVISDTVVGFRGYKVGLFLDFSGSLFDYDTGIEHGQYTPEAWYSAGGVAVVEADDKYETFIYNDSGQLSVVDLSGNNHMSSTYMEDITTQDFSGFMYECDFDLYTASEVYESGLDLTAEYTSRFWVCFLDSGADEPTYVLFFNEECFSREQALAVVQSVKKR